MANVQNSRDYLHPQYRKDREALNAIMVGEASSFNLADLARLRVRYDGFQGARDIQRDLDKMLTKLGMTETELFAKTREIHQSEAVFTPTWTKKGEDWS
ncbi:MAG: DUF3288 family protein [Cyanobacteria bacterium J06623_4]